MHCIISIIVVAFEIYIYLFIMNGRKTPRKSTTTTVRENNECCSYSSKRWRCCWHRPWVYTVWTVEIAQYTLPAVPKW